MKDSGIGWIKEIPENWNASKIGTLYELRNTKVNDKDYKPLSVTMNGIVPQLETAAKTNAHDDRKLVCEGDFVINSRSDRRGSCGISSYDGSVSLINIVLRPFTNMNPVYYNWLFHTVNFADEFFKWGHGIVDDLWTTGWQEMKNIIIPTPPIDEQKRIAAYLDEQCKKIDEIMADIQNQIDTLEDYKKSVISEAVTKGLDPDTTMKDSGVSHIDSIPSHWKTLKLKYASTLKGRIGWQGLRTEEYRDEGPYLVTGTDFNKGYINWSSCVHVSKERFEQDKNIQIQENDLLITKDGTIGKIAMAKECPAEVSLNSGVFIVRNNRKYRYNDKFFYYIILSKQFSLWFELAQRGNSTIKHLTQEKFYEFTFAYPPIAEQAQIVDFLDDKCGRVDSIVEDKKAQLETIENYKKSLIYEYVTGKKEVPENE